MQTISDLLHSLIESSKERIKTPITGAFICSFFIYNWRPIFLLLFSDTNIEYKIAMIDYEYCNLRSILWPLAMAFIYTLLVPIIMLFVDEILIPINKRRMSSKYKNKIFEAGQEKVLNDIVTGNKTAEELLAKIASLEEANVQRALADKNTIDSLNQQLNQLNITLKPGPKLNKSDLTENMTNDEKEAIVDDIYQKLDLDLRLAFHQLINSDDKIDLNILPSKLKNVFLKYGLFIEDKIQTKWLLTDIGLRLFNKISKDLQLI